MRRALNLARRGLGCVEPNPMVGCVIVDGRDSATARILGEGYHRRYGGPHAEIHALRAAGGSARGATAYVTLEPCAHVGKTPPCVDALLDAGIHRVITAMKDPNPLVAGRGIRRLRRSGVDVRVGCLGTDAHELNRAYIRFIRDRRPHVILKWAQGLDGRIATPPGEPRQISSKAAHRWVHRLRARVDGVLVGIGTVLADDARLTARGVPVRRVAARIVLDSRLRLPPDARVVRTARRVPTIVFTTRAGLAGGSRRSARLEGTGVEVVCCRDRAGRVDLADVLHRLHAKGMTNILVEGGAAVLAGFLDQGLADEAFVFVAPRIVGGPSPPLDLRAVAPVSVGRSRAGTRSGSVRSTRRVGSDTLFHVLFDA